ncbi:hypothetical protein C4D60_Mb08t01270 [Musa balbisiana]|uniref:RING-type E3 ubiquitin transferase n=1 Tax=Musa balbisiana TaxID=52838 RepID=A0A4S8K0H6_MUSBA|nr:hypothetical protein C4D60_Mb08t01270 [Musa balbisiana]
MNAVKMEERMLVVGDPKLHGGMFRMLSTIVCKVLEIFPFIEAARPRSKTGIQALCSLHVALDKAKGLLHHCSDCSKLYLAITGESILHKFEKSKSALQESLRCVEGIVPEAIACQIMEIVGELETTNFILDHSEKQAGDKIITLLRKYRKSNSSSDDNEELESFHQAASRLGITSSRAAVAEKRALKKLMEKVHTEEDKRKEAVVAYLYHLMRKYSKLSRPELADDLDSQGSAPCSPAVLCSEKVSGPHGSCHAFDRQLSKLSSLNLNRSGTGTASVPIPPEEFRCPISLQLMYDPVIISSGQTYERACIEKWFSNGHVTCPKTQQHLSHLCLTPNQCVKGLIAIWCEQHGVPVPDGAPDSADHWRLSLSQYDTVDSRSLDSTISCKWKGIKEAGLDDCGIAEEIKDSHDGILDKCSNQDHEVDELERYQGLLAALEEDKGMWKQSKAVEQIGYLLKDDEEARIFMGSNGAIKALVQFLRSAIHDRNDKVQEIGVMALVNLAVDNNRNKVMLITAGVIPLLEQMISNSDNCEEAIALYLDLSCLDEAKPVSGLTEVVPLLVQLLRSNNSRSSFRKLDALCILHNLSMHPPNIPALLSSGVVDCLHSLIGAPSGPEGAKWTEKALAVLVNLASTKSGREEMVSTRGLVGELAEVLDTGEPEEQEKAVSCLLILCNDNNECSQMVLQEGVVPSLVSISLNGTSAGQEKARKLLKLFREQRQREQQQGGELIMEARPSCKARSKKLNSIWKNKSFALFQC